MLFLGKVSLTKLKLGRHGRQVQPVAPAEKTLNNYDNSNPIIRLLLVYLNSTNVLCPAWK